MTEQVAVREVSNRPAIFLPAMRSLPAVQYGRLGRYATVAGGDSGAGRSLMMANPRRVAVGLEQTVWQLLLAVLHRHGGLQSRIRRSSTSAA